ncbi:DUF4298 domain-containing protein [Kaistella yonginensis]|uniref:DUF4298 domain-containing protein n=1 Tax=Kaistella yonginensis TaxID=658267 RepID=UPI0025B2AC97|nr:DUF4298 domain-containing protein [Kaistella yonginensis]MDN3606633.1 DUF4298 domain-containing protein [Kaistella yonginensis]
MEERLENIQQMENILNHTDALISEMEILIKKWKENEVDFHKLMDYYGSEKWHNDRKDDEEQRIPQDFPRGVLSEDAVHNTYGNRKEVAINMVKTGVSSLE